MTALFDLPGPSFLLAYAAISAGTIGALALLRGALESRSGPLGTRDPYLLAHLRGGEHEVVRLATVLLVDRGVLVADGASVSCGAGMAPPTHEVERAIVDHVAKKNAVTAATLPASGVLASWAHLANERLRRTGLLPGSAVMGRRAILAVIAVLVLVATASHKLELAHERGRHNTGILSILCVLAPVVALLVLVGKRRTSAGDHVVADLKTLFAGLRERTDDLRARASNAELALIGAVFGIGAVPAATYAFADGLFPRARAGASSSSCGASGCGSSSGCGGGGCGGGGCGGGCGGCGG